MLSAQFKGDTHERNFWQLAEEQFGKVQGLLYARNISHKKLIYTWWF